MSTRHKEKGVPRAHKKRAPRHPLAATDAAEFLNLLRRKPAKENKNAQTDDAWTNDIPRPDRDDRDPYGKLQRIAAGILADSRDDEERRAWIAAHPKFADTYEALLQCGFDPSEHSSELTPRVAAFLRSQK